MGACTRKVPWGVGARRDGRGTRWPRSFPPTGALTSSCAAMTSTWPAPPPCAFPPAPMSARPSGSGSTPDWRPRCCGSTPPRFATWPPRYGMSSERPALRRSRGFCVLFAPSEPLPGATFWPPLSTAGPGWRVAPPLPGPVLRRWPGRSAGPPATCDAECSRPSGTATAPWCGSRGCDGLCR